MLEEYYSADYQARGTKREIEQYNGLNLRAVSLPVPAKAEVVRFLHILVLRMSFPRLRG